MPTTPLWLEAYGRHLPERVVSDLDRELDTAIIECGTRNSSVSDALWGWTSRESIFLPAATGSESRTPGLIADEVYGSVDKAFGVGLHPAAPNAKEKAAP